MNQNEKTNIIKYFIPRFVSNHIVIFAFECMRRIQRLFKFDVDANYQSNLSRDESNIDRETKRYIENQRDYSYLRFGKTDLSYSGCEIIAVYNTLLNISKNTEVSKNVTLADLIKAFEQDGMVRGGLFGTAPGAIRDFFLRMGLKVRFSANKRKFDEITNESDAVILTFYNNRNNILNQVHTVCVTKERDELCAHNVYCNGQILKVRGTLTDLIREIHEGKAKGISVIGIRQES